MRVVVDRRSLGFHAVKAASNPTATVREGHKHSATRGEKGLWMTLVVVMDDEGERSKQSDVGVLGQV